MIPFRKQALSIILLILLLFNLNPISSTTAHQVADSDEGNLLANGDFEIEDPDTNGFKWYPPNHYLALNWYRWWVNDWPAHPLIPEYDDMRPTGRWPPVSGTHGQVYFKWGANYKAGIYQVVENVTPCMPHEFTMYVCSSGNAGTQPHAQIALGPQGTRITTDHDHNDLLAWPPYMQWSAEQTNLHTWEELTVTTEPLGTKLTAITYANPLYTGTELPYYDTWWDNGKLYQRDFPDGKLPEPADWRSSYLENVNAQQVGEQLNVTWTSTGVASTQVWYTIEPDTEPVTLTTTFSHTVYLPLCSKTSRTYITTLDSEPVTSHSASISLAGLKSEDRITYQILSRRPETAACVTEGLGPFEYVIP
ncbi:MAG: hypothetical protein U9Q70_10720 [Chloroflexota bacterium]|nr:hypothetical protein [Chloroflexota bacterium]